MAPQSPPSPREPLPEPMDNPSTTRKKRPWPAKASSHASETTLSKPSKILPQPVQTTSSHSAKSARDEKSSDQKRERQAQPQPMASDLPSQKPRRFAPEMIDTSRRRRRSTDTTPCVTPSDKTDAFPGSQDHPPDRLKLQRPTVLPVPPANSPIVSTDQVPQALESKFSSAKLAERRRHSFRIPDLPKIPSQPESQESSLASLSTSPSADSDQRASHTHPKVRSRNQKAQRNSQQDGWSGYILSLAAQTAEKQLREQAMAAYPNERSFEHPDHYAFDRDSDEGSDVAVGVGKLSVEESDEEQADQMPADYKHRESNAGWDMAEMRQHQNKLEQQKQEQWIRDNEIGRRRSTHTALREAQQGRWEVAEERPGAPPKQIMGWQKDNDIELMQKAASPPMAGTNLTFPKSMSPRITRLDVYQFPWVHKSSGPNTRQQTGLWTPAGGASRQGSNSGLWMGVCNISRNPDPIEMSKHLPTGLITPQTELSDSMPLDSSTNQNPIENLPPSPVSNTSSQPPSAADNTEGRPKSTDSNLRLDLNDAFVTQLYNYLSLGFPSLARKFDAEISKITHVPISTLRRDDFNTNVKGYVGAPEGTGAKKDPRGESEGEERCERWCALRLYVREWGRQQMERGTGTEGGMGIGKGNAVGGRLEGGWGAGARKGSWAF